VTEMNLQDYNVVFPHMTSMTREAVAKLLYEYDQARNVDSGAADMVK
jgi:hypothetical protein